MLKPYLLPDSETTIVFPNQYPVAHSLLVEWISEQLHNVDIRAVRVGDGMQVNLRNCSKSSVRDCVAYICDNIF